MPRRSAKSMAVSAAMRRYWRRKKAQTAHKPRKIRREILDALDTLNRFVKRQA